MIETVDLRVLRHTCDASRLGPCEVIPRLPGERIYLQVCSIQQAIAFILFIVSRISHVALACLRFGAPFFCLPLSLVVTVVVVEVELSTVARVLPSTSSEGDGGTGLLRVLRGEVVPWPLALALALALFAPPRLGCGLGIDTGGCLWASARMWPSAHATKSSRSRGQQAMGDTGAVGDDADVYVIFQFSIALCF